MKWNEVYWALYLRQLIKFPHISGKCHSPLDSTVAIFEGRNVETVKKMTEVTAKAINILVKDTTEAENGGAKLKSWQKTLPLQATF